MIGKCFECWNSVYNANLITPFIAKKMQTFNAYAIKSFLHNCVCLPRR